MNYCNIILISCIIHFADGHNVTLYSLFNDNNQTLEIDVRDACVNIPGSFLALNGGVSGVNTQGICTVVYSLVNCKGHVFVLKLGIDEHYDLKRFEWDNLPQSIGPCVMRRVEKEVIVERHNSLDLTIIICALITAINAGLYVNFLRKRSLQSKREMLNRTLPPGKTSEGRNDMYIYDIGSGTVVSESTTLEVVEAATTSLPTEIDDDSMTPMETSGSVSSARTSGKFNMEIDE